MNVLLEPTAKVKATHFIDLTLIYPYGEIPPNWEMPDPDVYTPTGPIHANDYRFSSDRPEIGKVYEAQGFIWTVKALDHYVHLDPDAEVKHVWTAYCTKDGTDAKPYDWDNDPPIQFIVLDENLEWVTNGCLNPMFRHESMKDLPTEYQAFYPTSDIGSCPEYRIYWA